MNKLLTLLFIFITSFTSPLGYAQEIDASLLENLSADQINLAKEAFKESNQELPSIKDSSSEKSESLKKIDIDEKSYIPVGNWKYGYDFISTSPTSIIATGDLPLPNDYKISIGDEIGIILSGSKDMMFNRTVQLDGTILFPELGSISVAGESFQDIKTKLNNIIEQSYIGVRIDLSLKNLSAKKITIVGAVNNPGTYLVNPFTTISNSLAYSGGIQRIGSLRNIKLIRANKDSFSFDLYDLLINGNREDDITIESGDVILVGPANKFIDITGHVKRPGSYEVLQNENLSDLLRFSLGFKGGANTEKIILNKLDPESSSITKVITNNINHSLKNVLSIDIYPYQNDSTSSAFVSGAIKEPGYYSIEKYKTLEDIINEVEFIDVYPWLGVLEQFDENNLIKTTTLFNLRDPDTYGSIKILPNSKIFFGNIDTRDFPVSNISRELISDYSFRIFHKSKSYVLPAYGRIDVESFVNFLGLDMSDVDSEATYVSPLDNMVIRDNYQNMEFKTKKYNTVTFRSPVNDLIRVNVMGAVDYPGSYIMNSDSVVEDVYKLVGNLKKEAYLNGIIFTRENVRKRQLEAIEKSKEDLNKAILTSSQKGESLGDINVIMALSQTIEPSNLGRVAGDFSPQSFSSLNTVLLDGDTIFIPRKPNTINVFGEVLNPSAFEYNKKLDVESAIDQSGGYQDYADKRKVYVIKSNGTIERVQRNIFARNVKLEAGDTIVVPRKIITNNPGIDALLPITKILSDIAFTAAALESLSNSN